MPSVETVGDDVSYLEIQFLWFLTSVHTLPLIVTFLLLSFRKIGYASLFFRFS